MAILPDKPLDRITWSEAHQAPFSANAVAIGTTAGAVTALGTLTSAARSAAVAQLAAQEAARTATNTLKTAIAAMTTAASDILKQIKVKAATSANPNAIYDLAVVPPPAIPSPVGPPGTPTAFKASLNPDGSLAIAWKCANPANSSGTVYQVSRAVGTGALQMIGTTGNKKFIDDTVPRVASPVTYSVQAVRSTTKGTQNDFVVKFGVGGAGEATASVMQSPLGGAGGAKLAA